MRPSNKSNTGPIQATLDMDAEMPASASPASCADKKAERRKKRAGYYRKWEQKNLAHVRSKQRERHNKRYANDPEFAEAYRTKKREWGQQNREKKRAWTKRWQANNREHREDYRLRYEYGITLKQYFEILEAQGGVCMLCLKPPTERRLAVDHDHVTGKVRGLMHRTCNSSFRGIFGDDPKELHRAFLRFGYMADAIRSPGAHIPGGLGAVR